MSIYGSPFQNTNSGIVQNDRENKKRLQQGLSNWWKSTAQDEEFRNQIQNSFDSNFVSSAKWAAPLAGLALGKFYTDAFCSPRYFYFRYFMMALFTLGGYKYASTLQEKQQYSFWTKNYPVFPKEIQDAIRSNDARYIRKWWQESQ
ncbi:hypothetical protein PPERSA_05742 [Pseudocohnilembus persalinus]|uniref:Uncharacterized protein n=1 Tax=Pseudocohnilembus persalinus TaxID=266149 RepID=A0A0V0QI21_PSEPJ|nr:hypothetical protein PPERSA_05742 [Pseudocohnilembus persalinus]|eukprot:KRX01903.1 hypothetical protein PPERSA_05742 [Pseudocohnilembus persalinus]